MKVLKGFGIGILSFLLFLSLSVFGIAFMINSTLLNPDFIAAEVDKIDVSTLVIEITEEQIGEQLPEEVLFLKETFYEVISEQEPWLKEQVKAAIYSGYDYFLGKSESLDIVISLEPLKTSLRDSLWQTFNDYLSSDLTDLPEYLLEPFLEQYYQEFASQIPKEYLPPELASLPEDQLKDYIVQHFQELAEQMPEIYLSPEIADMLKDQLESYFDQYYQEIAGQVPSELTVDESLIPPEAMEQIVMVRQGIGYFQTAYGALIGFMVLLIAGIILIHRNVRNTTRELGIIFLVYGVLEFIGIYLAKNFALMSLPLHDIPLPLQTWLTGLYSDLLAPLQMFSLGVLIGGVVLLVVSFVYKPREAED
jgi:hypothetical protein